MTLLPTVLLVSLAWAQPASQTAANGEPSKAVQQQQKQADYARKGHPKADTPNEEQKASLRTNTPAKAPKPKKGEAAVRVQK